MTKAVEKHTLKAAHTYIAHVREYPPPPGFKVLFSGFLQFNVNFVDGENNSKYRDSALKEWQSSLIQTHFNISFACSAAVPEQQLGK